MLSFSGLAWFRGACCLLISVLSTPRLSKQMAIHPESGSARDLFLLKGVFLSTVALSMLRIGDSTKEKFQCDPFFSLAWQL